MATGLIRRSEHMSEMEAKEQDTQHGRTGQETLTFGARGEEVRQVFIVLLRMVHNLKLVDGLFVEFLCCIFGPLMAGKKP